MLWCPFWRNSQRLVQSGRKANARPRPTSYVLCLKYVQALTHTHTHFKPQQALNLKASPEATNKRTYEEIENDLKVPRKASLQTDHCRIIRHIGK